MKDKIKILIIGRSNTGKSSLFNVLCEFDNVNKSIVFDGPETTRDIRFYDILLANRRCQIIDTPGLLLKTNHPLSIELQKATLKLIANSHLLFFVTDALEPNYHLDFALVEKIQKQNQKIFLLINKCDNPKLENSADLWAYDFNIQPIIKISSKTNYNINYLKQITSQYIIKNYDISRLPTVINSIKKKFKIIYVALIGKPNVGKSSLLNAILKKKRSQVSPIPGTTRDPVQGSTIWKNYKIIFLDTAGLGRKTGMHHIVDQYSIQKSIRSIEKVHLNAFLVDLNVPFSKQDKKILNLIKDRKKNYIIIFTKKDKMKAHEFKTNKKEFFLTFPFISKNKSLGTSSLKREGLNLFLNSIIAKRNFEHNIKKTYFENIIRKIHQQYFLYKKRSLIIDKIKIKSQDPIELELWVKNQSLIPKDYISYIKNYFKKKENKTIDLKLYSFKI